MEPVSTDAAGDRVTSRLPVWCRRRFCSCRPACTGVAQEIFNSTGRRRQRVTTTEREPAAGCRGARRGGGRCALYPGRRGLALATPELRTKRPAHDRSGATASANRDSGPDDRLDVQALRRAAASRKGCRDGDVLLRDGRYRMESGRSTTPSAGWLSFAEVGQYRANRATKVATNSTATLLPLPQAFGSARAPARLPANAGIMRGRHGAHRPSRCTASVGVSGKPLDGPPFTRDRQRRQSCVRSSCDGRHHRRRDEFENAPAASCGSQRRTAQTGPFSRRSVEERADGPSTLDDSVDAKPVRLRR